MPSHPSPDETRTTCRRLLGAPKPRAAACHYCGSRANTGGPITLSAQGWDLVPGPGPVRYWRCPDCRQEMADAGAVYIPVRIERKPSRLALTVYACLTTAALLACLAWHYWRP